MTKFDINLNLTREERFIMQSMADAMLHGYSDPQFKAVARKLLKALYLAEEVKSGPAFAQIRHPFEKEKRYNFDLLLKTAESVNSRARLQVLISIERVKAIMAGLLNRNLDKGMRLFDNLLLNAAKQDIVILHEHDHPSGLTDEQRKWLTADDHERYYIGFVITEKGLRMMR